MSKQDQRTTRSDVGQSEAASEAWSVKDLATDAGSAVLAEVGSSGDGVLTLAQLADEPTWERAIDAVREFLGMEVAFVGELTADREIFRSVRGDGDSFGFHDGEALAREETYCQRVLEGRLPAMIGDVRADDRAASLAITQTADVGAFVSISLRFSDGNLYGMLCAASHHAKPGLGYRELQFLNVFARIVSDVLEREMLQRRLYDADRGATAVNVLLAAVDARDSYTSCHSKAVIKHAAAVGHELGLEEREIIDLRNVAALHDIGKLAMPDSILNKPGPLTDAEWEVMRTHPIASAELLDQVPSLRHLSRAVRAEHERWDGSGYPDGLAGAEIPLASRITLVCDALHAMTSDRPYRQALSLKRACAEIAAGAGSQFCPSTASALLEVLEQD